MTAITPLEQGTTVLDAVIAIIIPFRFSALFVEDSSRTI